MAIRHRIRHRRWPRLTALVRGVGNDDGTSLIELVVGMMLMSVFSAFFTVAVVSMNRAENKTEAVSLTSSQLNQAFLTLDKTVRYASAISAPAQDSSNHWYVTFRTTNTGHEVCTQLGIYPDVNDPTDQQLQWRTWNVDNLGVSNVSTPVPLASFVIPGSNPFSVAFSSTNNVSYQLLTVSLITVAGAGATQQTTPYTFTAINGAMAPSTASICDPGKVP